MKANNGSGDNEERDIWETPDILFKLLNTQYNFDFDCCAEEENTKCGWFSTDFEKTIECGDCSWMNPPFSKAEKMFEHFFKVVKKGVAIYRCDNFETKIWQEKIFPYADWVFIPNRRIVYEGMEGKGARFPSALIGIGVDVPEYLEGVTLKVHSSGKK